MGGFRLPIVSVGQDQKTLFFENRQFGGHFVLKKIIFLEKKKCFCWKCFFEKIIKKISQIFYGQKFFGNFEKIVFEKKFPPKTFFFKKIKFLSVYRGNNFFCPKKNYFCQKQSVR